MHHGWTMRIVWMRYRQGCINDAKFGFAPCSVCSLAFLVGRANCFGLGSEKIEV